ncbi:MAG: hypothetical protein F4Z34_02255 [Acidimicrobiaceae bacterium]|nr:hypothetical protein [Acidimicrobiaceae bacterium]
MFTGSSCPVPAAVVRGTWAGSGATSAAAPPLSNLTRASGAGGRSALLAGFDSRARARGVMAGSCSGARGVMAGFGSGALGVSGQLCEPPVPAVGHRRLVGVSCGGC